MKHITTHLITLLIGALITIFIFAENVLPKASNYISTDPQYISLSEKEPIEYGKIMDEMYLGKLYFTHPLYFLKRQRGYEILSNLANQGYTPAANALASHYTYKAVETRSEEDIKRAHTWSVIAAKQGQITPLHSLIFKTSLLNNTDISDDISLLESLEKSTTLPWLAESLSEYFKEHGQTQKATQWASIREEKIFIEPKCSVITPWIGY